MASTPPTPLLESPPATSLLSSLPPVNQALLEEQVALLQHTVLEAMAAHHSYAVFPHKLHAKLKAELEALGYEVEPVAISQVRAQGNSERWIIRWA